MPSTVILGISAYYHDSAAALIVDGEIVAAAQEERFTRIKHDPSFPHHAISYVLSEAELTLDDVHTAAFYEKPLLKFERLMETCHAVAPHGICHFLAAMPVWIKEKLFMRRMLQQELGAFGTTVPPILFPEHHLSHAASAFYPSPFEDAAILTIDGAGEWATTTICHGRGKVITLLKELSFPHSLGLLYSSFTYYCGFRVNDGEYKLMGLAPYGRPGPEVERLKDVILKNILQLFPDGSFRLDMQYFGFAIGLTMTNDKKWERLFGFGRRMPDAPFSPDHLNLARAAQEVTEEIILRLARTAKRLTGSDNLTLAGGVALNCVANSRIKNEAIFREIWVQPAAGDGGGALGAALAAWHIGLEKPRMAQSTDGMKGALLGPEFDNRQIRQMLERNGEAFTHYPDFSELCRDAARLLQEGNVVGWFQGRMEYGPRALGNRSILADARNLEMQKKLNLKIKFREGFRPFAPAVLEELADTYFHCDRPSPYMLFVAPVQAKLRKEQQDRRDDTIYKRVHACRSEIPAVTHVDYSARLQTVDGKTNPRFRMLLEAFRTETGCPVLVNTSFNVKDEPIVCTPADALRCFHATEMDYLVMENSLVRKK